MQGSVSGLRRVFHTRVGQVTVAADRADVLAGLVAAAVDEQWLAARLVYPYLPHPLADGCLWQGMQALADDCYLLTGPGQAARVVRWWRPPEPVVPLAEAAPTVAQTLVAAVEARTRAGGTISCDLSGGLDSTPLCFVAARGSSRVIAVTLVSTDSGHDDARWAQRPAGQLGGVEHLVLEMQQLRDLVPAAVLQRSTKGDFSADWHAGLRHARAHLAGLLDDLALARLGLVDADALRKVCLGLYPYTLDPVALDRTLGCEAWLRTLTPAPPATAIGAPP